MLRKLLALDGIRLGIREWGSANSSHSKRILALHGWLDNANSFTFLGPYLAEKGYHVVALDHIGHGHSDHLPKGGTYTLSRSVAFTRDAMDALGWESSHVVGHSMGASISLMYSAVFPEKVEKLVLIEGFGPLIEPAEATTRNLRRAIDGERSMRLKNSKPKLYASLSAATDARESIVKSYPGTQYLSREAARALVSRGSRLQKPDGSAPLEEVDSLEDVVNDTDGPLRFRHDQRLVLPSMNYHTREQVYSYFHHLQAQTLLLTAENGWPMTPIEEFNTRRAILEEKGILQAIHTEGSHHPHLDPETAPTIARHIEQFLSTTRVPRKE